ncbi:MAG: GNAT family N-acetyltransferase [Alphaproteobacteria bacterium]|nr:GNAT family N-acetyltransferase [Alphaproteobacteria bacterium]
MAELTLTAFDAAAEAYDAVVDRAPVADRFCTTSDWLVPAYHAFADGADTVIHRFDEGWVPLMAMRTVLGRTWMPLEASWGLASALVGEDEAALASRFAEAAQQQRDRWDTLFLSGLRRGGPAFTMLVRRFGRSWRLGLGQASVRCVASLEGGLEGFLGRRTAKHRKNLRAAERRGDGLRFEIHAPRTAAEGLALLDTILDVERRSWKGREGHGIDRGAMRTFYSAMVPRLAARGALRVTLAHGDDGPVGYVLGGLRGASYRGLQISFDERHQAVSLGNLLQLHTVTGLCAEGVEVYDLGMHMPYKERWAEQQVETVALVVR